MTQTVKLYPVLMPREVSIAISETIFPTQVYERRPLEQAFEVVDAMIDAAFSNIAHLHDPRSEHWDNRRRFVRGK